MAWLLLFCAGLLEVCWATGLKYSEGFTRPIPTVFTVVTLAGSMVLLAMAARSLPLGTAYGVWVGIGAVGALVAWIVLFGEALTPGRLAFAGLLLLAITGLRFTSS